MKSRATEVHVFTHSEPGGHAENEDACAVSRLPDGSHLGALADGQGGRAGGARAAQLACQSCLAHASTFKLSKLLAPTTWLSILAKVDQDVMNDAAAGYTTLVAFCVTEEFICGAANGDSAALLVLGDSPGIVLTEHQCKNPPIGFGDAAIVPFAAKLSLPWKLVVMSDGVWKYAGWESVQRTVREQAPENIAAALRERAQTASGRLQDDFTVVVMSGSDKDAHAA